MRRSTMAAMQGWAVAALLSLAPWPSVAAEAPKPAKAAAAPGDAPMAPEVKKLVDAMQAFYEKASDFQAHFEQTYHYATFKRVQKSSGQVIFKKPALMRWDYEKPSVKTIVVAGTAVYMYDAEAQQLTKAPFQLDKLSASVSFLLGRGKLADEFRIAKATRADLTGGTALELVPKQADPRFDRIFFVVDPKTSAVTQSLVVDPDGSENHMTFTAVKTNQGLGAEAFHFEPPAGTQIIDMTQGLGTSPAH
jgi:outer membrane lipoprotein carrier protein